MSIVCFANLVNLIATIFIRRMIYQSTHRTLISKATPDRIFWRTQSAPVNSGSEFVY
jgi:hypothetical protein